MVARQRRVIPTGIPSSALIYLSDFARQTPKDSGLRLTQKSIKNLAISASRFDEWEVTPLRGLVGAPFIECGIFTHDGSIWKRARALVRPTFNKGEIADLDSFEVHVKRFLALIPKDSSTFDMLALSKRLFLDTSTEFLFGQSIGSLLPQTPFDTAEFMRAFDLSLLGIALRILAGPFRFLFILDPTWKRNYTKVHDFVDKRVAIALERQRSMAATGKSVEKTSFEKYILLNEMAMVTQDPLDLRAQILNVFFPARDTSAITFANILFELARHPEAWKDLRGEVLSIDPSQKLTFEFLKTLKTTKFIINETLRVHLATSRVSRAAARDTILPVGGGPDGRAPLFIPKGREVDIDLHTLHRDLKIWGNDANDFKPQRWAPGRPLWEAKWQYEPFLGGPRMCPAQNQVLTQLTYLLVRVAQEFQFIENRDEVYEYVEQVTLTNESKRGVKIALVAA
ncbi:MAG: hypothetical protein MMC33_004693 [Icmadophila ericetorum]|nr:hypothetical protein [Icmadophila ericetorum]